MAGKLEITMPRSTLILGAALCLTSGALVGQVLLPTASAEEPDAPTAPLAQPAEPVDLRCRSFVVDLDADGGSFRARDATTEIGAWVREHEDEGWTVRSVDLEIGSKATGYPVAYNQVCLQNTP